jgi:hypothetical protein
METEEIEELGIMNRSSNMRNTKRNCMVIILKKKTLIARRGLIWKLKMFDDGDQEGWEEKRSSK